MFESERTTGYCEYEIYSNEERDDRVCSCFIAYDPIETKEMSSTGQYYYHFEEEGDDTEENGDTVSNGYGFFIDIARNAEINKNPQWTENTDLDILLRKTSGMKLASSCDSSSTVNSSKRSPEVRISALRAGETRDTERI